ncbi:HBL341Wp [Eremothecium sinecaudum]|uniref:HBL341Wp n=1 Tax=Eremothecium sinecaudum TaxID=45286 RepID=A0A125RDT7_9SACH|nr:HBL341Wp [Eremothecium sinecaudum]AMD18561.1 HBL341Wp [Eremothecium sinecaudum]
MNLGNDQKFLVQVDETEDTEWNDILRQHGVIPERPPSPTAQLEEAIEEALQKQHDNRLEGKDFSDLEELEDDEDEEFLEFYKQKRMAELQKLHQKSRFGQVFHITKPEYNEEITQCSMGKAEGEGVYVFAHLSSEAKLQSRLLSALMQQAASKFPDVKFVDIPATRAIENYPEDNTPTLLVYYKGDVVKNLVTLLELGGNNTTLLDLEKLMVRVGAVNDKDERLLINQDDEESREQRRLKYSNKKGIRSGISDRFNVGVGDDYDDDDDAYFN